MGNAPAPEISPEDIEKINTIVTDGLKDYLPAYKEKYLEIHKKDPKKERKTKVDDTKEDLDKTKKGQLDTVKDTCSDVVDGQLHDPLADKIKDNDTVQKIPNVFNLRTKAIDKAVEKAISKAVEKAIDKLLDKVAERTESGEGEKPEGEKKDGDN